MPEKHRSSISNVLETQNHPQCGEIWMCSLPYKSGSVQSGYRPVFILSNDVNNLHSSTLNIIPITSKMRKRNLPVHVELLDHSRYGLESPSIMLIEQIMTVSKSELDYKVGAILDCRVLQNIQRAIAVQFPIVRFSAES